jgi:hypothetical protein
MSYDLGRPVRPALLIGVVLQLLGAACVDEPVVPDPRVLADPPPGGHPAEVIGTEGHEDPGPAEPSRAPSASHQPSGSCGVLDSELSVMAIGPHDCRVTVGQTALGNAPFFNKRSPSGRCHVQIQCSGGERYSTTIETPAGGRSKVIVKADMWDGPP